MPGDTRESLLSQRLLPSAVRFSQSPVRVSAPLLSLPGFQAVSAASLPAWPLCRWSRKGAGAVESLGDRPLCRLYRSSGCQQKPSTCYRFAARYPVWHLDSRRIMWLFRLGSLWGAFPFPLFFFIFFFFLFFMC